MTATAFAPPAAAPARQPAAPSRQAGRIARPLPVSRWVRGRSDEPAWARPGLLGLLLSTAVLYLWDLGASGWANAFYSAAAQAGSKSWEAFFFGSSDAGNSITVDKPPAALWVMDLAVRVFGLSSWSLLVPEALMGVGAVWLLHRTVSRVAGPGMGLLAGGILATTPVAALMFRFDNPDAIVVLLLVAATYGVTRALEAGRTRWLVLAATCVGTAFLAKMLQAYLVLPAFTAVWLYAAPVSLGRRVTALLWAGLALVVSSGWWILAVVLTPAADRPYIGGSQDNSIINLLLGYNGFGRLTGNEAGSVGGGGGGGGGGGWGVTGLTRLFNSEFGAQASWLLPAALVLFTGGLWARGRAPRTDALRAALLLWGGSLIVTAATFSFGAGIIHPYYTVALAAELGGTVALGAWALWLRTSGGRSSVAARMVLAGSLAVTADWGYVLLGRISWHPELRGFVLAGGLLAAGGFALLPMLGRGWRMAVVTVGICAGLLGPAAYSVATAATPHTGAIPSAGPSSGGGFGGGMGGAGGGQRPTGTTGTTGNAGGGMGGGGVGSILGATSVSTATATALSAGAAGYTWVVATVSSNSAAGYQLATGDAVMAIGGFNGTDPSPTLAQFQADVAAHKVHYYLASGGGGMGGTSSTSTTASAITAWVQAHYSTVTLGGTTFYDLTAPTGS